MSERYTYHSIHEGKSYSDEAIVCPVCGEQGLLDDVCEKLDPPFAGEDASKHKYRCPHCDRILSVTMMIACWRTMVEFKE